MENLIKRFFFVFIFGIIKLMAATYEPYVDEIVKSFSQEMKKEFNLICIGDGGSMPRDVETIKVSLVAYRRASIEEARELEVKSTQRLVQLINNHEKIRTYLREYPFTPKRAEVAISFQKKDDSDYTDGSVSYVSQIDNKIYYRRTDPKTEKLVRIAEETFDEALKLVKGNSGS